MDLRYSMISSTPNISSTIQVWQTNSCFTIIIRITPGEILAAQRGQHLKVHCNAAAELPRDCEEERWSSP
jgi:hypothetical protein